MQVRAIIERMKGRGLTYEDDKRAQHLQLAVCGGWWSVSVANMESQTNRSEACQYVNGALGEDQWRRVER
jgi:hypothetical protein